MTKRQFIEAVKKELGIDNNAYAELATEAVLQTLHDRLNEGQANNFEEHLPRELRPYWSRGLTDRLIALSRGPEKMNKREFLARVQERSHLEDEKRSEQATCSVFKAIKDQLPEEDAKSVGTQLPRDLKNMWRIS